MRGRDCVIFGSSSSLKRTGVEAFGAAVSAADSDLGRCGLEEIIIPDSVCDLCVPRFKECSRLRGVTFGSPSLLEWTSVSCFERTKVDASF